MHAALPHCSLCFQDWTTSSFGVYLTATRVILGSLTPTRVPLGKDTHHGTAGQEENSSKAAVATTEAAAVIAIYANTTRSVTGGFSLSKSSCVSRPGAVFSLARSTARLLFTKRSSSLSSKPSVFPSSIQRYHHRSSYQSNLHSATCTPFRLLDKVVRSTDISQGSP